MDKTEITPFLIKNKLKNEQVFKVSRFKEVIKRTLPHKHDGYFELIILLEGVGFHWVDTQLIPIAGPMAFFLSPGQLHCWQLTSVPKGFVVLFRADFIDPQYNVDLYPLVQQLEQKREILLPNNTALVELLVALENEYLTPSRHSFIALRALMQLLLVRLLDIDQPDEKTLKTAALTYRRFIGLLRQPGPLEHRVSYYADILAVSPQHLNAICRRVQGKSASELVAEHIILDSKRYLLHTDQSITDVSEQLGFMDASHFVKYFRKKTGHTPLAFRKQYGF